MGVSRRLHKPTVADGILTAASHLRGLALPVFLKKVVESTANLRHLVGRKRLFQRQKAKRVKMSNLLCCYHNDSPKSTVNPQTAGILTQVATK